MSSKYLRNKLGKRALEALWYIDTGHAMFFGARWKKGTTPEEAPKKHISELEAMFDLYQKNSENITRRRLRLPSNVSNELKSLHDVLKNVFLMRLIDYYKPRSPEEASSDLTEILSSIVSEDQEIKLIYLLYDTEEERKKLFNIPNGLCVNLITTIDSKYKIETRKPINDEYAILFQPEKIDLEDRCRLVFNALQDVNPTTTECRIIIMPLRVFLLGRPVLWGRNLGYLAYKFDKAY